MYIGRISFNRDQLTNITDNGERIKYKKEAVSNIDIVDNTTQPLKDLLSHNPASYWERAIIEIKLDDSWSRSKEIRLNKLNDNVWQLLCDGNVYVNISGLLDVNFNRVLIDLADIIISDRGECDPVTVYNYDTFTRELSLVFPVTGTEQPTLEMTTIKDGLIVLSDALRDELREALSSFVWLRSKKSCSVSEERWWNFAITRLTLASHFPTKSNVLIALEILALAKEAVAEAEEDE